MEGRLAERIQPLRQRGEGPDHGRGKPPADGDAEGTGLAAEGDDAGLDQTGDGLLPALVVSVEGSREDAAVVRVFVAADAPSVDNLLYYGSVRRCHHTCHVATFCVKLFCIEKLLLHTGSYVCPLSRLRYLD